MLKIYSFSGIAIIGVLLGTYSIAAQARGTVISNDISKCSANNGPAVLVTVRGVRANKGKRLDGKVRVQAYHGVKADWLERGRWINRIESLPSGGDMKFCLPVPKSGEYGVAVRHDINGNGKTDLSGDGGGFSNNPKLSVFRLVLGKSAVPIKKAKFNIGAGVKEIVIDMRYR